jgi:alkanesulfonate monooxygenase SsuD/methylene tetrahydromethanopterin reductase-like flavin-dependent oxidoreductase (luciferase family)
VGVLTGSWPLGMPSSGEFYSDLATRVERLGFDMLFAGDHLFMHNPNPEAVTVLSTYAALTRRVLIGTAVLLPALREPALAAKQLATLDFLSGGRLVCGVGVGGEIEQEWSAMEVPRAQRGRRTDEYLALMGELWAGRTVDFDGTFRSVHGVQGSPAPSTPGGPPVWVGGRSDLALQRAARHDGWCAYASSPRRVGLGVERINELRGATGAPFRFSCVLFTYVDRSRERAREMAARVLGQRYAQDFDRFIDAFCAVGTAEDLAARVEEYRGVGVQDLLLCPQAPWEEVPDQIEAYAHALGLSSSPPIGTAAVLGG